MTSAYFMLLTADFSPKFSCSESSEAELIYPETNCKVKGKENGEDVLPKNLFERGILWAISFPTISANAFS